MFRGLSNAESTVQTSYTDFDAFCQIRINTAISSHLARGSLFHLCPVVFEPLPQMTRSGADRYTSHLPRAEFSPDVTGEVVQNGLPPGTLLLLRVGGLTVEADGNSHALRLLAELNDSKTVTEAVLDQFVVNDPRVLPREVEPERSVLGLHSGGELASGSEVDDGCGGMPVGRRCIPGLDVFGRGVRTPYLRQRCLNQGGYSDSHFGSPGYS